MLMGLGWDNVKNRPPLKLPPEYREHVEGGGDSLGLWFAFTHDEMKWWENRLPAFRNAVMFAIRVLCGTEDKKAG